MGKALNPEAELKIFFLLFFLAHTIFGFTPSENKSVHSKQYLVKEGSDEIILGYQLYLPQDYEKSSESFPLILFLHGAGRRGNDLNKVLEVGLPRLLEDGKQLPFVVVSPQCPVNTIWSISKLDMLLDYIVVNYRIDTSRIYLTGFSMGGAGTWGMAMRYPERFAAIAPVCGWEDTTYAGVLKDLPIWVFHGEEDQVISVSESENLVNKISSSGGNIKFTKYPGLGHDIWYQTYSNDELYNWFLKQKRK